MEVWINRRLRSCHEMPRNYKLVDQINGFSGCWVAIKPREIEAVSAALAR
jgi:hypothetical protein